MLTNINAAIICYAYVNPEFSFIFILVCHRLLHLKLMKRNFQIMPLLPFANHIKIILMTQMFVNTNYTIDILCQILKCKILYFDSGHRMLQLVTFPKINFKDYRIKYFKIFTFIYLPSSSLKFLYCIDIPQKTSRTNRIFL